MTVISFYRTALTVTDNTHIFSSCIALWHLCRVLTIFLCMAMMYPMKGLSCTGVMCPLAIPLPRGVSGLQGTIELGPPLGMRTGLLPTFPLTVEPFAIGVTSVEGEEQRSEKRDAHSDRYMLITVLRQSVSGQAHL